MASDPVVTLTAREPDRLRASVCFPASWPGFAGHFPGAPLVPAVQLFEAAQRALVLAHGPLRLCAVRKARLRLPVAPDETIHCEVEWQQCGAAIRAVAAINAPRGVVAEFELELLVLRA